MIKEISIRIKRNDNDKFFQNDLEQLRQMINNSGKFQVVSITHHFPKKPV